MHLLRVAAMNIHELFEAHFAEMHDCEPEDIAQYRMGNG